MSDRIILNNNKIIRELLEEEAFEDELIFNLIKKKRKPPHNLFSMRESEGFFNKLINEHLVTDNNKFRDFFRVNQQQFHFILSFVKDELTKEPTQRVPRPILPDEKLAVTLR